MDKKDLSSGFQTIEALHPAACTGCHACMSACPARCIRMKSDRDGFLYPEIDQDACIGCGKCARACPVLSEKTSRPGALQDGYAACSRQETVRRRSSSGGVFTHLAERILEEGGAAAGAVMSRDCRSVFHTVISTKEGLPRLRGSKYVQSRIGDTFEKVRAILETGRPVLFSGTPCQIGGLYGYLGREYENLYTVDIVCHGVPAPSVWNEYVSYREQEAGGHAVRTLFRDKKNGWRNYALRMEFDDGDLRTPVSEGTDSSLRDRKTGKKTDIEVSDNEARVQRAPDPGLRNHAVRVSGNSRKIYFCRAKKDPYMRGYLADLYLRTCCHDCAFKTADRQSDITLADFWGIQEAAPSMDDDLGVNFVWVHSPKGQALLDSVSECLRLERVDTDLALAHNPAALHSAKRNERAADFHTRMCSLRSGGLSGADPARAESAGPGGLRKTEPDKTGFPGSGGADMKMSSADNIVQCIADCCREPVPQRIRREGLDFLSGVKRWMKR